MRPRDYLENAGSAGTGQTRHLGFGVADQLRMAPHQLPVVCRFVRERLNGDYIRDEALQARELTEALTILDAAGVDGASGGRVRHRRGHVQQQIRYDLDMNAVSLVKTYRHGKGVLASGNAAHVA